MIDSCEAYGASVIGVFTGDGRAIDLDTTPLPDDVLDGWIVDGTLARPYHPLIHQPIRTRYQLHADCCPTATRESSDTREPA